MNDMKDWNNETNTNETYEEVYVAPQQDTQDTQAPAEAPKKSGLATAGFILGIIGAATAWIPFIGSASFVLGVLALVFGAISLSKKAVKTKATVALVLGIVSIIVSLVMQAVMMKVIADVLEDVGDTLDWAMEDRTEEILDNDLDVTFGSFRVVGGSYWEETQLKVTVKNTSDTRQSFTITVEAIDEDGFRLAEDYIFVDELGAGQSQRFKIFTDVPLEDIADMKNATFCVVDAYAY